MPEGLAESQPAQPPGKRRGERGRPGLPRDSGPPRVQGEVDTPRPAGAVAIADLFLTGVYDDKVQTWFRTADAAVTALRARAGGEDVQVPRVPTVTVTQEEMPRWARGIVWDCADPTDCHPVRRSDRTTRFAGARQLDREALRVAAETLAWGDRDIVSQAGEGG
eukprot:6174196-Pleurochrysis_carterae.AAC.1